MDTSEANVRALSRLSFSFRQCDGPILFEARHPTNVRKKKSSPKDTYALTFDQCVIPNALPLILSFEWVQTEPGDEHAEESREHVSKEEPVVQDDDEASIRSFEEECKIRESPGLRWTQGFTIVEGINWYANGSCRGSRIAVDRRLEDGTYSGLGCYGRDMSPVDDLGARGSEIRVHLNVEDLIDLVLWTDVDYASECSGDESNRARTLGDRNEILWPNANDPTIQTRFA